MRLSGQTQGGKENKPFTFSALIAKYQETPAFARKKESTKNLNRVHLKLIGDIWGSRLVSGVRAKHVLELRDAYAKIARKADHVVSMLSTIIAWGIPRDYAEVNPCREIGKLFDSDGWVPWDWEDIEYAAQHLKLHLWQAAALALYTGQRLDDTLQMTWSAIKHGEISVVQSKTRKRLWIPLSSRVAGRAQ